MSRATWDDAAEICHVIATTDVRQFGWVHPTLVGFDGADMIGMVELRPHAPGDYRAPLIEGLALLVPLGADRLAYVASGRAWSLDDPIPPVTDGVDLRQSVAVVHLVDHHERDAVTFRSLLFPFERDSDGSVEWGGRVAIDDEGEGPIPGIFRVVLERGVGHRDEALTSGRQALRLLRLGHGLQLPDGEGADARLAGCILAALESERAGDPQPEWTLSR